MELNELQKKRLLNATGVLPNNNSLLLNNVNKKKLLDASGSTSSSETLNLVGNKTTDKKKELENTNRNFFQNVLGNVSEWAVGDDADWGTYWERGLGKSNINLMMQYHTKGEKGLNWKDAFKEEPDDTGALERAFETIVGIGADLPTFVAGGAIAGITESKLDNTLQASNITAHGLIQLVPEIQIIADIIRTRINLFTILDTVSRFAPPK